MLWWCHIVLGGLIALLSAGCGHVLSETVRQQADDSVSFAQLQANPEAYTQRVVIFGGEIVQTRLTSQGSLLEVVQKPLTRSGAPRYTDRTEGRFMALCGQRLDPAVYSTGRLVTIAGRVLGSRTAPLGEVEYIYPLLSCLELYLWPKDSGDYEPYPWWYWEPYPYWFHLHYYRLR